jgi:glucosyl-3-phosphoglycerate synthase
MPARFHHSDFKDLANGGHSLSVVLPAREVAGTVGAIVESLLGTVDQVLVVDAASEDGSADVARAAGAEVVQQDELAPQLGPVLGKGDALWRSLPAVTGDLVAFIDSDTHNFDPAFARGLFGPLIADDAIQFVKGAYSRPFVHGDTVVENGGGRVSALMARPLLRTFHPELAWLAQPLAGEVAARRDLLERIPFATGYALEIRMLIDVMNEVGPDAIAEVDLGERRQPHQPLTALTDMAEEVLRAVVMPESTVLRTKD